MLSLTTTKGCWTCKDRKIACDKHIPGCKNCLRSKRRCLGYGIRLSWPRKDDRKRALVSNNPDREGSVCTLLHPTEFVNVYASDVNMYFSMHNSGHNVARLLTSANNSSIQNLVFRMSFTDTSPSSNAILYAVYALSSQHLLDHSRALEYKSLARSAVWTSTSQPPSIQNTLQCIVAVLLLALYESFASPNASQAWAASICYCKTATIATYALDKSYEGDLALVLDWVYYYDVHSKFAVRHFDRRVVSMLDCARKKNLHYVELNSPCKTRVVPTLGCSLEVLNSISSVIDTVLEMEIDNDPHVDELDKLERRLKFTKQEFVESPDDVLEFNPQSPKIAELYRLAGLIYLHRAGRKTITVKHILQGLVEEAFTVLQALETCERSFPLFIVGCEARSDRRRAIVLGILKATQIQFAESNVLRVRAFIERFWAQDDLDPNQDIDYSSRVTAVLSRTDCLPVFS
ncbi:uncharacterized protein BDR25DRAFT_286748 [Lindgomyces ingoldianus]|uniref:Uncharacterized protein n=1 Tax=Lindgomyces ingoldianus TaxID=673940 RepID=A0ACB6QWH0_9PLEO|nr:uncharacterized protein BDR25DRAFT_286748 [Lindgomyces ingoldianus]KAF2470637.1 hypothetical protein BDR25DRAFT_286748 [Lindgomyces ingoldianus]